MKILTGPVLKERTSLGMGGRAQVAVRIQDPEDWDELVPFLEREGLRPLVLGRGSNLLVQDGDLPLCLVLPQTGREPQLIAEGPEHCVIRVSSGYSLIRLLHWLRDRGLAGMEGLIGIPAQVGGAVAMNAGSFGQSVGDCLHRVRCWSPGSGLVWLDRRDLQCTYRTFRPQGLEEGWVIHEVELALTSRGAQEVGRRMQEFWDRKRRTQPVGEKTCGCTFKNPEQAPAGLLLDRCGMRGKGVGDVQFSAVHANFLINRGNGRFAQAWELISQARSRIRDWYGVDLELEVQIIDPGGEKP
ncbi:MAG: UDP-N-acetylmuramate dehydrogenase [Desulfovermiculus sp.]|nr:UDP-N-acetylmuramate dehydrogenase [Desulfovermiculus sp.]